MKTLIKILCLSVLWFSCENPAEPEPQDTTSPIVTITYPVSESQLTETTIIRAEVSDDSPITKVIFFIDGISVFEDVESPYEYEWDICSEDNENHTILVKAEDESGNQGQTDAMPVQTNGVYDCYGICGGIIFDQDGDGICDDVDECPNDADNDADNDGICDDIDSCVGEYDDCGICNGENADIDDCGICFGNNEDKDCNGDCFGTAFEDDCGVCSGGNTDHDANSDQDDCGECFGNGLDADNDGICDDVDDCVGEYDDCGICNGENADIDDCGICFGNNEDKDCAGVCFGEAVEDCAGVCNGNAEYDECGICNGDGLDADNDGICDDVDDCVGEYDDCGVCNGNGVDADNDGICDDVDDCVGDYDCLGECNGNAEIDYYGSCCDNISMDNCGICFGDNPCDFMIDFGEVTNSSLEITYYSNVDIASFQFTVSGLTLVDAMGGAAEDNGFTVSIGSATGIVIGFSFDGSVIPAGAGTLTNLEYIATDSEACITDVVITEYGQALDFVVIGGCIEIE